MRRILVFAYACEPGKGSEPGAGWSFVRMLATFAEVHVLTRKNNREVIEEALPSIPERDRLHFHFVDPPAWLVPWKRGSRGIRSFYVIWMAIAFRKGRSLHRERRFDLAWHLTLANAWLGSTASLLGLPFVYGPVGGGVGAPLRLIPSLGVRGVVYEGVRSLARLAGRFANPLARMSWRRADLILVQNPEGAKWFPPRYRDKTTIFQHAVLDELPPSRMHSPSTSTALYSGRLLPWKGVHLAISAIARLPGWTLRIAGEGPDRERLERHAQRERVLDRVTFLGSVERSALLAMMRDEVDVFLFPSLHDDAPFAVAEAVVGGVPVVCLAVGGPPLIVGDSGIAVSARGGPSRVVRRLAQALQESRAFEVDESRRPPLHASSRAVDLERLVAAIGGAGVG